MGTSTTNGKLILRQVGIRARKGGWSKADARRTGILCLMCARTESGVRVLANPTVPESLKLPHDGIGYDHDSVGLYQQRVPMWGPASECMNIASSTDKFINELLAHGTTRVSSKIATYVAIQQVQVSDDPTGHNYRKSRTWAFAFSALHWSYSKMVAR